ncbi:hypothetical protein D3C79_805720 [compost metagenome]
MELGVIDGQVALGKHLDHLIVADGEGVAQAAQNIVVGHVDSCGNGAILPSAGPAVRKSASLGQGEIAGGLPPHLLQGILQLQQLGFELADGHAVAQLLLELGE